MYIPEDKIREILNSADIVDIVSESVLLKKAGSNFLGLCPFHSEKTPSFSVSPHKQIFHCFGCSTGGNVFSFLMKHQGISFPEAVRSMAKRYGIHIEQKKLDPAAERQYQIKEGLYRLNKRVMDYYSRTLRENPSAEVARAYLEKRGITPETCEQFHIGYAPDSWDTLVGLFKSVKISRRIAEDSGLVLSRNNKPGHYDRFRNRIMFPIVDVNMQIAGFGGRVMDDSMPKYMNSPETPVYSKKKILYGLHATKQFCRQTGCVHVVEGYFDFISLYQHGIKNVVASLGTALTREHVRLLKGHVGRAILVFDSDEAGVNAARKSIDIFMSEGLDVRILVLPQGEDPDSFVMKQGAEAFQTVSETALSVIDFLTETAVKRFGMSVEGKIRIIDEMKFHLASVTDSTARSLHIRNIAQRLGVDESAMLEKVRTATDSTHPATVETSDSGMDSSVDLASDRREMQVLSVILQYPELVPELLSSRVFNYFYSDRLRRLGEAIADVYARGGTRASDVLSAFENEEEHQLLSSLAMVEIPYSETIGEKSQSLIKRIIQVRKKDENSLINQIRQAEQTGNSDLPLDLLKQRQEEIRKLHGYN